VGGERPDAPLRYDERDGQMGVNRQLNQRSRLTDVQVPPNARFSQCGYLG
jgi:hypothetical protein